MGGADNEFNILPCLRTFFEHGLLPYCLLQRRTALRCACDERCIGVISTLLKKGSDITSKDIHGVTAIEAAIESGHEYV